MDTAAYTSYVSATGTPQGKQAFWMANIELARKELTKFHARGNKIVAKYLDERGFGDIAYSDMARRFNLFHSNVNILKAALYSRLPEPEVLRRFKDGEDDVARVAAKILERNLEYELHMDRDCDEVIKAIVMDRLLPGLGVAWCRYEADITPADVAAPTAPDTAPDTVPDTDAASIVETVTGEATPLEYVYWEDVLWSPARTWREVWWIARRVYMTRDDGTKRFGDRFKTVPLVKTAGATEPAGAEIVGPRNEGLKRGVVYEIWDRRSKKVIWIAQGQSEPLDEKDDLFGLPGFFPTPKPLMSATTSSNLIPYADYMLCQDQYEELNHINSRISFLVQACKAVGVYDKSAEGTQRMLQQGVENQLIPVDQWAAFAEKGGLRGVVDWLPVEHIINVISQLNVARESVKQQIYELTGLSDIIRGASVASETAAAQKIKAQYASVRLTTQQEEVARFLTDLFDIKATLMCRFYQPDKLLRQAGALPPEDVQYVPAALELLKTEYSNKFRILISVDTFTDVEWQKESEERMLFLQNASQFIEKASAAVQGAPEIAPMMFGLLKFAVAGFRVSRDVEGIIDAGMASMMQAIQQKQQEPPPPDPEMLKLQAAQAKAQMELQLEQQRMVAEMELERQKMAAETELERQKAAAEIQLERQKMIAEMEMERERMLHGLTLERQKLELDAQVRREEAALDVLAEQSKVELAEQVIAHEAAEQALT
jgi:hypothetical protein